MNYFLFLLKELESIKLQNCIQFELLILVCFCIKIKIVSLLRKIMINDLSSNYKQIGCYNF